MISYKGNRHFIWSLWNAKPDDFNYSLSVLYWILAVGFISHNYLWFATLIWLLFYSNVRLLELCFVLLQLSKSAKFLWSYRFEWGKRFWNWRLVFDKATIKWQVVLAQTLVYMSGLRLIHCKHKYQTNKVTQRISW